MAIERSQQYSHAAVLAKIETAIASEAWDGRLAVVELAAGLLGDLPSEKTVERLIEILSHLARDSKWEVRRAVVPVLVDAGRPAAKSVIERLTTDENQWVRQTAERAKRKLARITSPADKQDKRARFAFDAIKELDGRSAALIYQAAIRVGEQSYEELAGDTAHELNTYRASMEGLLQELEVRLAGIPGYTPAVIDILQKIRGRSRYLKALVVGLVEYSRDPELLFEDHLLEPIASEAIDLAKEKTATALDGHDVETVLAIPDGTHLEACRERLFQALVNLLSNALESVAGVERRGRVTISAQAITNGHVSMAISDNGIGMDAAQLESATKRFRSLRKDKGGIGLGLPLALKILEREHGGRLEIDSSPGVGTTVTIELPVSREPS